MKLSFQSPRLRELCNSRQLLCDAFDADSAVAIGQLFYWLDQADCLADIPTGPPISLQPNTYRGKPALRVGADAKGVIHFRNNDPGVNDAEHITQLLVIGLGGGQSK